METSISLVGLATVSAIVAAALAITLALWMIGRIDDDAGAELDWYV
jgi:hypothetical protein